MNSNFNDLEFRDYEEAFENAIKKGLCNPDDYMYMYSDNKYDYFKNSCTRSYKKFRYKKFFNFNKE